MKMWKEMPGKLRIFVCIAAAALGLLFLGAVRVQDGMNNHITEQKNAHAKCQNIAQNWSAAAAGRNRDSWQKLAAESPELCLQVICPVLTPLDKER